MVAGDAPRPRHPAGRRDGELTFRYVDIPDEPEPEEAPDTNVLSDRDRVARDAAQRDGRSDPFSAGDTPQPVLRTAPDAPVEMAGDAPARPTPPPTAGSPTQPQPETAPPDEASEASEVDPGETAERLDPGASRPTVEAVSPSPTEPVPAVDPAASLPPRQPSFRRSLARLESFVRPEAFDNPEGGVGGPTGVVSFDTKGYDLGPWLREILTIIERNWKSNIPPAAHVPGMRGATFVHLTIVRETTPGAEEVARIVVEQSWTSQVAAFDQAALFALEISDPLPPIPAYFPYDALDGRLGFLYNLDPEMVTFPEED